MFSKDGIMGPIKILSRNGKHESLVFGESSAAVPMQETSELRIQKEELIKQLDSGDSRMQGEAIGTSGEVPSLL